MMRLVHLALTAALALPAAAHAAPRPAVARPGAQARATIPLDSGWRFVRRDVDGAPAPAFDDAEWSAVTLPHTYNGADGDDGGGYYRGPAWYRRALAIAAMPAGRRAFLQFDGAALATDVYVNGTHVGRHEGGHGRFRFDVTTALRPGRNIVAVRVDNGRNPAIAPLGGDFTVFGGLYRRVFLVETDAVHVELLDHGGPGVYITQRSLGDDAAAIEARVLVRNDGRRASAIPVRITARDAAGRTVATGVRRMQVAAGETATATVPLTIADPHRWHGRDDPYLYSVTATLPADSVTVPLGLRTARFDADKGFLLNGRPYPLHGVNLFHPGRPGRGLAVTDAEIGADMQTLDELGATGVRFVHFQHPDVSYDEADRRGFAVWTEIGLNGIVDPGAPFEANVAQQMRELIRQTSNHPSVVLWGLGNEVYATTPDVSRVLRRVQAVVKAEDPSRPTIYAHCCQADDVDKAKISDVIAFNRYFGWYPEQTGTIGQWADRFHKAYPEKPFLVGEYGAGASIRQQQLPPLATNVPAGPWHPEQAQTRYHERNWPDLEQRPFVGGSFVWVAFDLASDGRNEGDRAGINDKGLVTYDRAIRKDAFYWYQANWSKSPMLHIVDRRLDRRTQAQVPVKVYSNFDLVTLTVNGLPAGTVPVVDHVAAWPAVTLAPGVNRIAATAVASDGGKVSDTVTWAFEAGSMLGVSPIPEPIKARPPAQPAKAPPGQ